MDGLPPDAALHTTRQSSFETDYGHRRRFSLPYDSFQSNQSNCEDNYAIRHEECLGLNSLTGNGGEKNLEDW